jgi:TolB-like protein
MRVPFLRSTVHTTPLLVLAAALALVPATPLEAQQDQDKRVVGVLRYENNSGDAQYDHLGRAFSSMMISDLSAVDRLQLIERERLEEVMDELDLQQSGYVDEESAQSLGMIVGAEYLVLGSFVTVEPEIRMDTRVTRVETTEIVTTGEVTGQKDALFDLQQSLADQIIDGLEIALTEEEQRLLAERQQENRIDDMETLVGYSQALCYLDNGSYAEALDRIQEVQRAAPGSRLIANTLSLARERAVDSGRDRARNEVTRRLGGRLGGLLGRREPEPSPVASC